MLYECWGAALTTKKKDIYVYIPSSMVLCALSSFVGFIFKKAWSRPRSFLIRSIRFRFTTHWTLAPLEKGLFAGLCDSGLLDSDLLDSQTLNFGLSGSWDSFTPSQ